MTVYAYVHNDYYDVCMCIEAESIPNFESQNPLHGIRISIILV